MENSVDPDPTFRNSVEADGTAHNQELLCFQKYLSWSAGLTGLQFYFTANSVCIQSIKYYESYFVF